MSDIVGNTVGVSEAPVVIQESLFAGSDPDANQADFPYYRALGQTAVDLNPQTHERMQQLALALYLKNPLAHRVVKMMASFAAGGSVRFDAERPTVQRCLVEHWNHPLNNWDRRFYQYVIELGIYGELFLTANVIDGGLVTWGHVHPARVKKIIPDERDQSVPAYIFVAMPGVGESEAKRLSVIQYDGKPRSKTRGFRVGDVLMETTNNVRGSMRGISDLFPLADYLDGLDQFMFSLQQRVQHQNNWIWDVTLEGMTETDIRNWLNSVQGKAPSPGAIRAHNERVKWEALTPAFSATESAEHARLFRNYLLAGAGFADWMVGDMGSANRAATENSAAVIMKQMEQRQREAKGLVEDVFNYVIDQKILAGKLPKQRKFDRRFYITMPKIGIRDFQRMAASLRQGAEGISKLIETDLIDPERGQRIAEELLSQLDLEGGDRFKQKGPILKEEEDEDA
jgi:hypothetical protein